MEINSRSHSLIFWVFLLGFGVASLDASLKPKKSLRERLGLRAQASKIEKNESIPPAVQAIMFSNPEGLRAALAEEKNIHIPALIIVANKALSLATKKENAKAIKAANENLKILKEAQEAAEAQKKEKAQKKKAKKKKILNSDSITATVAQTAAENPNAAATANSAEQETLASAKESEGSLGKASVSVSKPAQKDAKNSDEAQSKNENDNVVGHPATASIASATAASAVAAATVDIKQKNELAVNENEMILQAIYRIEVVYNLAQFLKDRKVSDVIKNFAIKKLQRSFERFFLIIKKNEISFDEAMILLHITSIELISKFYVEELIAMNPAHKMACNGSDTFDYAKKIFKKMLAQITAEKIHNVNPLGELIDIAEELMSDDVRKHIESKLNVVNTLVKAQSIKESTFEDHEILMKKAYALLNYSLEKHGALIGNILTDHVSRLKRAVCAAGDINTKSNHESPALFSVILNNRFETIEFLLTECKANPNVRDAYGRIPLLLAWDPKVKKLLQNGGANLDFQDDQGRRTALMTACQAGAVPVVQALIAQKANYTLVDADGKTAYQLTTNAEVLKLLDDWGAGAYERERQAPVAAQLKLKEDERKQKEEKAQRAENERKKQEEEAPLKLQRATEKAANKQARRLANQRAGKKEAGAIKIKSLLIRAHSRLRAKAFEQWREFVKNQRRALSFSKLERILSNHKSHLVFFQWKDVVKQAKDADAADLHLRLKALQQATELYQKRISEDGKSLLGKTHQAELNLISAGIRFVDYYLKRKVSITDLIKSLEMERQIDPKETAEKNLSRAKDARFDHVEHMFKALDKAKNIKRGNTIQEMLEQMAKEHSKINQIDESAAQLIDAIRANEHGIAARAVAKGNINNTVAALAYAHLHDRKEIMLLLSAKPRQTIDRNKLIERINALSDKSIAQRSSAAAAATTVVKTQDNK